MEATQANCIRSYANEVGIAVRLKPGSVILAADDSVVARAMLEQTLAAMGTPYIMTKSGKEAWDRLQSLHDTARAEGKSVQDKVALVLSDLEMPEMDGFTLTRNIKQDARFKSIPVVIHSSLSGSANELHIERQARTPMSQSSRRRIVGDDTAGARPPRPGCSGPTDPCK